MSFIDTCTEMLISAIKNGNSYRQYCAALEEIKKTPGLKEQVDELRRLNYQIQNQSTDINLDTALENLDEKMEKLCRIVEVNWMRKWLCADSFRKFQRQFIREFIWIYRICHKSRRTIWENKSENRRNHRL